MSTPTPIPPPGPVPLPGTAPLPTQTVVNLPSPHETGLPQSWATIIAACIAVIAALIALCGVKRQVAATAREGQKGRAADAKMQRQEQLVERMAKAVELSIEMGRILRAHQNVPSGQWENKDDLVAWADMLTQGKLLVSMLRVLGARQSSTSLLAYLNRVADIANDPASEGLEEVAVGSDLTFTMRDELESDGNSEVLRWVGGKRQQS